MNCIRNISDSIIWVGGNDRRTALFENLFPIPRGVSYNSYVILDEKTAVLDTADAAIAELFLENVDAALADRALDYLIVNHMEPDHCALIAEMLVRYPKLQVVSNTKALQMIGQFFELQTIEKRSGSSFADRTIMVAEGDTLSLGSHTLQFVMAPMVHWPEVMVTYEQSEKILFSADAFGTFGAHNGTIFADELNFDRDWLQEARRYYTNIVGKYGVQVQALLKKASSLDIQVICPLHGPIWRENVSYFLGKYDQWSRYEAEEKGVLIAYGSMYGHTENAANVLANELAKRGMTNIAMYDVSRTDVSELIGEAFRYTNIVLASPTYNGGMYPAMEHFLLDMKALNLQNRTITLIENGSWAPMAGKQMRAVLETMKNITVQEAVLTVKSSLKEEQMEQVRAIADSISRE